LIRGLDSGLRQNDLQEKTQCEVRKERSTWSHLLVIYHSVVYHDVVYHDVIYHDVIYHDVIYHLRLTLKSRQALTGVVDLFDVLVAATPQLKKSTVLRNGSFVPVRLLVSTAKVVVGAHVESTPVQT